MDLDLSDGRLILRSSVARDFFEVDNDRQCPSPSRRTGYLRTGLSLGLAQFEGPQIVRTGSVRGCYHLLVLLRVSHNYCRHSESVKYSIVLYTKSFQVVALNEYVSSFTKDSCQ